MSNLAHKHLFAKLLIFAFLAMPACGKMDSSSKPALAPAPAPPAPVVEAPIQYSAKAQGFIDQAKFQEAIWICEDEGNERGAKALKKDLIRTLTHSSFTSRMAQAEVGGKTTKLFLDFENSVTALFKSHGGTGYSGDQVFANANSEVASYLFDQLIGFHIVPAVVVRTLETGEFGSVHYYVKDDVTPGAGLNAPNLPNMRVFDYISGNSDRHKGNWLAWIPENRIIAIDHGLAFRGKKGGLYEDGVLYLEYKWKKVDAKKSVQEFDKTKPFNFQTVDPKIRNRLKAVTDEEVITTLNPYVKEKYLEKLLERLHIVQTCLENF
jgi:hypothetical protein